MLVAILKAFPFSADGIAVRQAVPGLNEEIPDALVPGLIADGYVGEALAEPAGGHEPDADEGDCPLSNADLRDSIKAATGKAPGPRTSRENLIEQYRAIIGRG